MKDFFGNSSGDFRQNPLLKYWEDSDQKTLQKVKKKLEIVPEVSKNVSETLYYI